MDLPFPALSPQQRLHFDIYGYVVIPEVLTPAECQVLIDVLQELKTDLIAAGEPVSFSADSKAMIRGSGLARPDNPMHGETDIRADITFRFARTAHWIQRLYNCL